MNVWNFTGRLGADAETRFTADGTAVVSFSAAVTSGYGDKEKTTCARCSMFGKRGEGVAPYLAKGQQVAVSGEATLRDWTDRDGQKRFSLEVRINDLTLVGRRDDGLPAQRPIPPQRSTPPPQTTANLTNIDDVPF